MAVGRHRLLLDGSGGVWAAEKVERIVEEVLVVGEPADRPRNREESKDDKRWGDLAKEVAMLCKSYCEDDPDSGAKNPAVVTCVDSGEDE
jgi:hypothetical protein